MKEPDHLLNNRERKIKIANGESVLTEKKKKKEKKTTRQFALWLNGKDNLFQFEMIQNRSNEQREV